MFGIGAKNNKQDQTQTPSVTSEQNEHFHVHTMADDVKAIESGVATLPQTPKSAPAVDALPARDASESPFLEMAPSDAPQSQTSTPTPAPPKSAPSSNPFFDHDEEPTVAPSAVPTPTAAPPKPSPAPTPQAIPTPDPAPVTPTPAPTTPKPRASDAIQNAQQQAKNDQAPTPPDRFNESAAAFGAQSGVPVDPFVGTEELHITEEKSSTRRIAILVTIIIATLLLVGALLFAWFWWKNTIQPTADDVVAEVENPLLPEEPSIPDPKEPAVDPVAYSVDLHNYITLSSIGTDGAEVLHNQLETVRKNVARQNIIAPISFIVANENQTPYSFRAFAERTDIPFPADVLEHAGDLFEIYAYRDQGETRFGIAFDVRDPERVREALRAHEGQLGIIMRDFLPPGLYVDEIQEFRDNIYGAYAVRYANLTEDNVESIDYTVGDTRAYIGTTLETLRAILEKTSDDTEDETPPADEPIPVRTPSTPPEADATTESDTTEASDDANDAEVGSREGTTSDFETIPLNPGTPPNGDTTLDLDL